MSGLRSHSSNPMRVSAIDIGTNTILLLIADIDENGTHRVVRDEHNIARLGKGVDAHRTILPATFDRALAFLRAYKAIIDESHTDRVIARGTSFLRDANNQDEFIEFIRKKLGLEIQVLSGDEEGLFTYRGAVSEFSQPGMKQDFSVIDIGGGSTEITIGSGWDVRSRISLNVGSVRITERFLTTSPPSSQGLKEATEFVREELKAISLPPPATQLIGVAGTLTTLAALDLRLPQYDRTRVSGHVLQKETIDSIFSELRSKTVEEITAYPQILAGRADIILAGILILREILTQFNRKEISVSDRG